MKTLTITTTNAATGNVSQQVKHCTDHYADIMIEIASLLGSGDGAVQAQYTGGDITTHYLVEDHTGETA